MKLSVIIVSYNVKFFLEQCLHSVRKARTAIDAEVIVIDNQSTDGSVEYLADEFRDVHFIQNPVNMGFGKANNKALQLAKGEYVLFLNPDTIVPEDCFEKCLSFLDLRPSSGALGTRMLDGTGRFLPESKRSFPTTSSAFYKMSGISGLFPDSRRFNHYSLGHLNEHQNNSVEVLAGAFMMVRKKVLDEIGGFDEQFFMYGEDIDLSYRIKKAGYENWYFSETAIIHFKGESTKRQPLRYQKMFYLAMMVFVNKHYKGKGAPVKRLLLKSAIAIRGLLGVFRLSLNRQNSKNMELVVAGSDEEFNACCRILENAGQNLKNIVHWQIDEAQQEIILDEASLLRDRRQLIFCAGRLKYATIINYLQRLGTSNSYRFYAHGSNSIVGSDSKHSVGVTVALHRSSFVALIP